MTDRERERDREFLEAFQLQHVVLEENERDAEKEQCRGVGNSAEMERLTEGNTRTAEQECLGICYGATEL